MSEAGKLGAIASAETSARQKEKRIKQYDAAPKLCKQCGAPLPYEKRTNDFCNHTCAITFNHPTKGSITLIECLHCKSTFSKKGDQKYCSLDCMFDFLWIETKKKLLERGIDDSSVQHVAKRYLTELHYGACQICKLSEWMGKPMPLVLDHIDGNSENNALTNLRVICNNCDAQTDTYKGRNKGNGRALRRERYKVAQTTNN